MTNAESDRPLLNPWLWIAVAFGLGWLVYLVIFLPRAPSAKTPVGQPADFRWKLLDLDDRPVPFQRFEGKPVFLNIWATWCPPCVREMPSIARLAGRPELKGVAFVCVSTDDSGTTVKRFLEGKDWPMTFVRATDAPEVFATEAIPATFMIAPDGKIAFAEVGGQEWDNPETVRRLQELLGAVPSQRSPLPVAKPSTEPAHAGARP